MTAAPNLIGILSWDACASCVHENNCRLAKDSDELELAFGTPLISVDIGTDEITCQRYEECR